VSCAAALAGLEVLLTGEIIPGVEAKGQLFQQLLESHHEIAEIRRSGLALGIDLADAGKRNAFQQAALDKGVVIDWYLFKPACFRIAPPLTITTDEIEEACHKVRIALDSIVG
jgi:acetylornithine/succinyldiaminopimelate/putrescine aminotransferase